MIDRAAVMREAWEAHNRHTKSRGLPFDPGYFQWMLVLAWSRARIGVAATNRMTYEICRAHQMGR